MALIKCSECGKEVSSKAKSCPNCGYPISNIEEKENIKKNNSDNDDVILVSKRDESLNKFKSIYTIGLGAISFIAIIVVLVMESKLANTNSRGNALLSGFIIVFLPCIILFIICSIMHSNASKTNLTLSKKGLFGEIYKFGSVSSITFPLDKISSINTIKLFGFINGIMIIPFNGIAQKIFFIDNDDEFKEALIKQINK